MQPADDQPLAPGRRHRLAEGAILEGIHRGSVDRLEAGAARRGSTGWVGPLKPYPTPTVDSTIGMSSALAVLASKRTLSSTRSASRFGADHLEHLTADSRSAPSRSPRRSKRPSPCSWSVSSGRCAHAQIVQRRAGDRILEFLSPRPESSCCSPWEPNCSAGSASARCSAAFSTPRAAATGRPWWCMESRASGRLRCSIGGRGGAASCGSLRTVGVEGEMGLPFAALQQLCSPILDQAERLPEPQRDALSVAFGLSDGQAPNPFLVGLAALGLLSEASQRSGRSCVSSMTRSGSIVRRRARSRSWPVAC